MALRRPRWGLTKVIRIGSPALQRCSLPISRPLGEIAEESRRERGRPRPHAFILCYSDRSKRSGSAPLIIQTSSLVVVCAACGRGRPRSRRSLVLPYDSSWTYGGQDKVGQDKLDRKPFRMGRTNYGQTRQATFSYSSPPARRFVKLVCLLLDVSVSTFRCLRSDTWLNASRATGACRLGVQCLNPRIL